MWGRLEAPRLVKNLRKLVKNVESFGHQSLIFADEEHVHSKPDGQWVDDGAPKDVRAFEVELKGLGVQEARK